MSTSITLKLNAQLDCISWPSPQVLFQYFLSVNSLAGSKFRKSSHVCTQDAFDSGGDGAAEGRHDVRYFIGDGQLDGTSFWSPWIETDLAAICHLYAIPQAASSRTLRLHP